MISPFPESGWSSQIYTSNKRGGCSGHQGYCLPSAGKYVRRGIQLQNTPSLPVPRSFQPQVAGLIFKSIQKKTLLNIEMKFFFLDTVCIS